MNKNLAHKFNLYRVDVGQVKHKNLHQIYQARN